ncbi:sensor histidine kinase [Dyadobacter sp. CY261]|uniref:sensor histidine kinase n=1 Tax=Dyadobacter sp. CY261 TaxID=2907203 RepID=UPI001F316959|nr:sensor histidine kinase [Dyadobacter sp. CY261]MCF0072823.1 sensor histidine kinase [Dyadobacter sp. CY261]
MNHRFWLHVSGWLAFFATPFILPAPLFNQLPAYYFYYLVATKIAFNLVLIAIFYLNLYRFTPQLLLTRNLGRFALYIGILLALVLLIDNTFLWGIHDDLAKFMQTARKTDPTLQELPRQEFFRPFQLAATVLLFALIILASSLWAVVADRLHQQEFAQRILLEKTSAELALLRQQISPHFLFNTLNNIRWLTRVKSDRAEDSIIELSEILRYMLYQAGSDKVFLADEITYLSRYVNLQRLRIHPEARIEFEWEGNFQAVEIEPLLFIPFVENAFKFGIDSEQSSVISIRLSLAGNDLLFTCQNRIFEKFNAYRPEPQSGIGIRNVRKRLDMYYPRNHSLRVDDLGRIFLVELRINNLIHG